MKFTSRQHHLFIITAVFLFFPLFGARNVQASGPPIWVEASGEAFQGDLETPKEVMERARRDGQNKAIEKALGIFIRSHTLVSNSQLVEDLIFA